MIVEDGLATDHRSEHTRYEADLKVAGINIHTLKKNLKRNNNN
jgi:hypothetical protein